MPAAGDGRRSGLHKRSARCQQRDAEGRRGAAATSGPHPAARPSGHLKERPDVVLPEVIYCWYQCKESPFIWKRRALAKNVKHRERCCCHSPAADGGMGGEIC